MTSADTGALGPIDAGLEDAATEREVLIEQVRLVYRMVSGAPWTMLGVSVFVAAVLHDLGPPIWIWLAVQVVLKVFAFVELKLFFPTEQIAIYPERMMRRLMIGQAPHAIGWAALTYAGAHGSAVELTFIIMMMGGVLGAGVTTYGGLPRIHMVYIASYVASEMVIYLLIRDEIAHNPVLLYSPLLTSIYCLGIFTNTRVAARTYRDSILLGFANTHLARHLELEVLSTRAAQSEAETANLAKSTFLAAASHDLRQPIHALGLFLALLDRSELGSEQRETLTLARSALTSSFEMLDALLDFSRAEAGVIVPRIQPFHLGEVLRQIEEEVGVHADEKRLFYRTRDCEAVVASDPSLVKIILQNLVTNAIRYTTDGGILVAGRKRSGRIVVEVWDSGVGIAPDQWETVFSDFVQLGNPERDRRKGLGLGLAIARRIARLIGSEVILSSVKGRGSVFRFSLPLSGERTEQVHAPAVQPTMTSQPANAHVLIIDDDETIRVSLCTFLRDLGYSVNSVETIAEGKASALKMPPNLLICDSRLRDGERGADAARLIRTELGRRLPVLLITGDTHPDRIAEAAVEDLEILYKPVPSEILIAAIADLLSGTERARRPNA